jgi:tRNA threonylcarbamoyladenosine biosynthesis protein TsaE
VAPLRTESPEQTEAAGTSLARHLARGDVVLVGGELGSGKTTFIRGACRALGVSEPVTSPTFVIGQLYRADGDGAPRAGLEVSHLDLYRLSTLAGEDPALLADYVTAERISFLEWPALAMAELTNLEPGVRVAARVRIEHAGGDARGIEVESPDRA